MTLTKSLEPTVSCLPDISGLKVNAGRGENYLQDAKEEIVLCKCHRWC